MIGHPTSYVRDITVVGELSTSPTDEEIAADTVNRGVLEAGWLNGLGFGLTWDDGRHKTARLRGIVRS